MQRNEYARDRELDLASFDSRVPPLTLGGAIKVAAVLTALVTIAPAAIVLSLGVGYARRLRGPHGLRGQPRWRRGVPHG